ncbi:hypothetical protein HDF11_000484 [Tunturiibacter psychrotolerans]
MLVKISRVLRWKEAFANLRSDSAKALNRGCLLGLITALSIGSVARAQTSHFHDSVARTDAKNHGKMVRLVQSAWRERPHQGPGNSLAHAFLSEHRQRRLSEASRGEPEDHHRRTLYGGERHC